MYMGIDDKGLIRAEESTSTDIAEPVVISEQPESLEKD